MDLVQDLMQAMRDHADNPALEHPDGRWVTYGELVDAAHRTAESWRLYIAQGDCAAVAEPHPYHEAVTILALMLLRAVIVPLPLKYGEERSKQVLESTRPKWICAFGSLPQRQMQAEDEAVSDAPGFIMFTSGSTGQPKGAMLTYDNVYCNIRDIRTYFPVTSDDHIFVHRSLSHASVLTGELLYGLLSGARMTFCQEAFVPRRILGMMERREITVFCTTPTVFYKLALDRSDYRVPTLRLVALMGEFLHIQVAKAVAERFPHARFYMNYGQTEAAPRLTYLPHSYFTEKEGCIGLPLPSVEAQIVDDLGRPVADGLIGELIVRGPNIFNGYWRRPEWTAAKLRKGWLHTGDMVSRGKDGLLYIVGRKDDMIVRAGLNIYPKEIEDALLDDPRVSEVVAYGKRDPKYGEKLCVDVVAREEGALSAADIMDVCRRTLPPFQYPDLIQIVDELPRSAAGKLIRRKV